ncbi:MAG: tRNA adenosine(34) deaminase TadA [Oscillospiraceae bacterium]
MRYGEREEYFMRQALQLARQALQTGDIPVGAVVVRGNEIIGAGCNTREAQGNALHHAEIVAIDGACRRMGSWRLSGCELFVTLEPCPMCAGAILNARIDRVVYGAADEKAGCLGSLMNLYAFPFNHRPLIQAGVLEPECRHILQNFFLELRNTPETEQKTVKTHNPSWETV